MPTPARTTGSRKSRLPLLVAVLGVAIALVVWQSGSDSSPADPAAPEQVARGAPRKTGVMRMIDGQWQRLDPADPRSGIVARPVDGMIRIEGKVYELDQSAAVPGVDVVFSGPAGESTTITDLTGAYRIDLEPGSYRAFVRGDGVLSIGPRIDDRLPTIPQPGVAGLPDDHIAPALTLLEDQQGIDLPVVRGGSVIGRVIDGAGRPVRSAVVRASGGTVRPVLGTDLAETDEDGRFRLDLPVGGYRLDASHAAFAGVNADDAPYVSVEAGDDATAEITLIAGCIIEGRVAIAGGVAAGDGAIERQFGDTDTDFAPAGTIESDGTFRWTTSEAGTVVLRAWPWKAPPSPSKSFACSEGARFRNVVLTVPDRGPDMAGVVVTADGEPARFAFLDITALSPGGINQQERADGDGNWGVFAMPPGDYEISVFVPDGGVVTQVVNSPATNVRLVLGGTGSIAGKVTGIDSGSFALELGGCDTGVGREDRVRRQVVVPVRGGSYRIDGVPACRQNISARAPTRERTETVTVEAGGVATLDLDLGPRRKKLVTGVVTDAGGATVEGAIVTAAYGDDTSRATTDGRGWYQIETYAGEGIYAYKGSAQAFAMVGDANVTEERVDLKLGHEDSEEGDMPDLEEYE